MMKNYCDFMPLPDLRKASSILVVQPHPDDMEIGAGATIAYLVKLGARITCLTVTDGSVGTYDPSVDPSDLAITRRIEAEKGAAVLGVNSLHWLDFADGGSLPIEEIRAEITRSIREVKPDAVMVCDPWLPYEVHSDHIRTGLAAAEAAFLANMPNFCPKDLLEGLKPHAVNMVTFYYTAFPNTFIDVSDTWGLKMKAIDCHQSQFPPGQAEEFKEFLTLKARNLAKEKNCGMAESLKVLAPGHLHIFEQAWQS